MAKKVVRRFCQWLTLESDALKQKFLHKQVRLLTNLARDYWNQVPERLWRELQCGLADRETYLERCMAGSEDTEIAIVALHRRLTEALTPSSLQDSSKASAVA